MRLEGKVALITGGGSGMGKVASELFANEGASVVLTDVNDQAGEATAGGSLTSGDGACGFEASGFACAFPKSVKAGPDPFLTVAIFFRRSFVGVVRYIGGCFGAFFFIAFRRRVFSE